MKTLLVLFFLCVGGLAWSQNALTALDAVDLLPKGEAAKVVRIVARDGIPAPERWYIIVHDPTAEDGFREYVIAGGEIVATRQVSQFAEHVTPKEMIAEGLVKIDSDTVADLARDYAVANGEEAVRLSYDLRKDGENAVPVWRVICQDAVGRTFGELFVTATLGSVVAHDGLPLEPMLGAPRKQKGRAPSREGASREAVNRSRSRPAVTREPVAEFHANSERMAKRSDRPVSKAKSTLETFIPPKPTEPKPAGVKRFFGRVFAFEPRRAEQTNRPAR